VTARTNRVRIHRELTSEAAEKLPDHVRDALVRLHVLDAVAAHVVDEDGGQHEQQEQDDAENGAKLPVE